MSKIDSIIFDLDGTLWSSAKAISEAWGLVLQKHENIEKKEVTEEELYSCMGLPMYDIAAKLFPSLAENIRNQLMDELCEFENGYLEKRGGVLYDGLEETLAQLQEKDAVRTFRPVKEKTAYTSSSQVQYVARCGNYRKAGYEYTGALKVLKIIFSYDYLWLNVRVKGGAYGCMSGFYRNGDTYMVSYRDPNLAETNTIFEQAAEYVRRFDVSERDMVKFIIGTIGGMDTPMSPASKGVRSFGAYICHTEYAQLKKEREEVLNATKESIRALAPLIETAVSQDYLCVVGNNAKIRENEQMFEKIEPLFL